MHAPEQPAEQDGGEMMIQALDRRPARDWWRARSLVRTCLAVAMGGVAEKAVPERSERPQHGDQAIRKRAHFAKSPGTVRVP